MVSIHFRKMEDDSEDSFWNVTTVNALTYVLSFISLYRDQADTYGRILEVFFGIICACTPAAAKSCNHHLKSFSTLKLIVVSQFSRIKLSTKPSKASLLPRTSDHPPGRYSNIDVYRGPAYTGRAQGKSIQTFVHKGKQQDVENDGIYLTFEMQNQFSQAYHPDFQTTTSLERTHSSDKSAHIRNEQLLPK